MDKFSAAEAKHDFFLTTQDLLGVRYESHYWGFGTGRATKLYDPDDLLRVALRKHGEEGLAKKRQQRAKREANKRQKLLAAEQALKEQQRQQNKNNENNNNAAPNQAKHPVASTKAIKTIQKDIRKAFKPLVTWDYLRTKNSQHGCNAVAHVPRVQPAEFAALIGRPQDTTLKTLVKNGAWYSHAVPYETVMGPHDGGIIGRGGRYGCNSQLGIDPASDVMVKFKPSDNSLSVTAYVRHVETFGFY